MSIADIKSEVCRLLGLKANEVECVIEYPDGRYSDGYQPPYYAIKLLDGRRFTGKTIEAALERVKREGVTA